MQFSDLTAVVTLVMALSVASERLVEIVKSLFATLDTPRTDARAESLRRAALQVLAVISGIATAWLSSSYLPDVLAGPAEGGGVVGLGLLASGGSGFWNSILGYVSGLKAIKKAEAVEKTTQAAQGGAAA